VFGVRVRLLRTVLVFVQWFRIKIGLGLSTEADVRDGGFQGSGVRGGMSLNFFTLHRQLPSDGCRLSSFRGNSFTSPAAVPRKRGTARHFRSQYRVQYVACTCPQTDHLNQSIKAVLLILT